MRWPWKAIGTNEHLVVSWSGQTLSYVLASGNASKGYAVLRSGVKRDCAVDLKAIVDDLKPFDLEGMEVSIMLRPNQYQLLQIPFPAVAPDELRTAVRYQIRDMLDLPIDDVRLDLIPVGDGQRKNTSQLFVVATPVVVIRNILDLCQAMRWKVSVIDIFEMAQRNLQTAFAFRNNSNSNSNIQAQPALVWMDRFQTVLTISANGELFNTRRFDFLLGENTDIWSMEVKNPLAEIALDFPKPVIYTSGYGERDVAPNVIASDASQYSGGSIYSDGFWDDNQAQRFLVELKRSFDLWERVWPEMPLGAMWLKAGAGSEHLTSWLSLKLGKKVQSMDVKLLFPDFEVLPDEQMLCVPLLGLLLRTEGRII